MNIGILGNFQVKRMLVSRMCKIFIPKTKNPISLMSLSHLTTLYCVEGTLLSSSSTFLHSQTWRRTLWPLNSTVVTVPDTPGGQCSRGRVQSNPSAITSGRWKYIIIIFAFCEFCYFVFWKNAPFFCSKCKVFSPLITITVDKLLLLISAFLFPRVESVMPN